MPPPEWLVEGIIPEGSMVGWYGEPGSKKTFTVLDVALSIAAGIEYHEHPVQRGFVVYISAEGGSGIGKRVLAWLVEHELQPEDVDVAWLTESIPVNLDSEEIAILINRLVEEVQRNPVLVVVDTLARCFDGDENQQEDMSRFVAGVDYLRKELHTTVLVIHHTNLSGLRERGNTAFRGATDTMVMVKAEGRDITLTCTKQRDSEEFEEMHLELKDVEGTDSAVVTTSSRGNKREEEIQQLVDLLVSIQPCKWDDWMDKILASGLEKKHFFKYRKDLTERGVCKNTLGQWQFAPKG